MFTGIIERTARIASVAQGTGFIRLSLSSEWPSDGPTAWNDVKLGDSIAVNGVCLTVAGLALPTIGFDVIPETLAKTNLGLLKAGDEVNIERALRAGDRMDGHFVQGHVDATAKLIDRVANDKESRLTVQPPLELMQFVVAKGSICIDGVSLTVASVTKDRFEVALIPTTLSLTTLGTRPIGWPFNFEADILSKTIVSWLERRGGLGR